MAYSEKFLRAIKFILPHEEEFARGHWGDENFVVAENVSGDSGGVTKYGIDASSHPGVDIRNLSRSGAIAIYWLEWSKYKIESLPDGATNRGRLNDSALIPPKRKKRKKSPPKPRAKAD